MDKKSSKYTLEQVKHVLTDIQIVKEAEANECFHSYIATNTHTHTQNYTKCEFNGDLFPLYRC